MVVIKVSNTKWRPEIRGLLYVWELLTVSYQPVKFGGQKNFGTGDLFLMIEKQDFTCFLTSAITTTAHDMLCSHTRNFRLKEHFSIQLFPSMSNKISPVLVTCVVSNNLWQTRKKLLPVRPKTLTGKKKRKKQEVDEDLLWGALYKGGS